MFSQDYLPFIEVAQNLDLGSDAKNSVLALAVAHAIAATVDLPSAPVSSPEQFYNASSSTHVNSKLSAFNEAFIFNVPYAQDLTRRFWLLRYYAAHDCGTIYPPFAGNSFFETFTGAVRFFPLHELKVMNENVQAIYNVRLAATAVLAIGK